MSDRTAESAEAEGITFYSRCPPGLEAGTYALRVDQHVEALREKEANGQEKPAARFGTTEDSGFRFSVFGPRFALDPSDVYSVHPAKGHVGDFAETLPHIVFTRRTLPWERHPEPASTAPWLGLIVLQPSDFAAPDGHANADPAFPPVVTRTLSELLEPVADGILPPVLGDGDPLSWLEPHERPGDLCATIDLPAELFRNVSPRVAEVALLTHVRRVDTAHKETASLLADGWFSVSVANRLPEAPSGKEAGAVAPVENRIYLISLEGLTGYLDPNDAPASPAKVRMAVLAHWSFGCQAAAGAAAAMASLRSRRLEVVMPEPRRAGGQEDYLRRAFGMGYTALNHATRWGERTVSWYRGPLSPVPHAREGDTVFRPTADAAIRYSPGDGMMDVSYAAAYQLGRLLALQDRHFAAAIHSFRHEIRRQVNRVMGRERTRRQMDIALDAGDEWELFHAYLQGLDADSGGGPGGAAGGRSWRASEEPLLAEPGTSDESGALRLSSDFDLRIPAPLVRWLSRLMLLYRVPFGYLIPDERMLPPDAIAFFGVDPDWLKCLAEGACSVGRSSGRDELAERALRNAFLEFALRRARDIRPQRLVPGQPDPGSDVKVDEDRAPPSWPLTGFLMRSPVVEALQGIEMRAWRAKKDGGEEPLDALRIDRLAPDIMLCIFDGRVGRIEMKQPPEALHFGLTVDPHKGTMKRSAVRRLAGDRDGEAGSQILGLEVSATERDWPRVIDVDTLARDIASAAKLDGLHAAGFGVQMVQSAARLEIKRDPEAKP